MTESNRQAGATARSTVVDPVAMADPFPTWAVIAYGIVTAILGVVLLVWPRATLMVAVVLLAIQFIVFGVVQLVRCLSPWARGAGERTLLAISGALALLAALLILRRPLQTLVFVTALIGAWLIINGVLDLVGAVPGGVPHRGWNLFRGGISLVAGIFVLLNPGISLAAFIWIVGLWMIASGIVVALASFMLRGKRGSST